MIDLEKTLISVNGNFLTVMLYPGMYTTNLIDFSTPTKNSWLFKSDDIGLINYEAFLAEEDTYKITEIMPLTFDILNQGFDMALHEASFLIFMLIYKELVEDLEFYTNGTLIINTSLNSKTFKHEYFCRIYSDTLRSASASGSSVFSLNLKDRKLTVKKL